MGMTLDELMERHADHMVADFIADVRRRKLMELAAEMARLSGEDGSGVITVTVESEMAGEVFNSQSGPDPLYVEAKQ